MVNIRVQQLGIIVSEIKCATCSFCNECVEDMAMCLVAEDVVEQPSDCFFYSPPLDATYGLVACAGKLAYLEDVITSFAAYCDDAAAPRSSVFVERYKHHLTFRGETSLHYHIKMWEAGERPRLPIATRVNRHWVNPDGSFLREQFNA